MENRNEVKIFLKIRRRDMDRFHRLSLLAELDSEHCELNHGPGVDTSLIAATDYLVLPIGYSENADCDKVTREMVIPVCFECIQSLQSEEWTLLYCIDCGESRWVCRKLAKNRYQHHVLWLKGCPDCGSEFGGLYFNDEKPLPSAFEKQSGCVGNTLSIILGNM